MDKKTKKEFKKLDKEVKDLHKTTIQVNNRFQKIMGLKNEEGGEESDEENDEVDDYLNNVNEEEVNEILQKAEQEMKEEEEEKKRQQKENEENKDKMEKMLKEELENISDEEKKKKKEKKKKEKNNSDENSENNDNKNDEESYKEFIEFQKWKKMKELQKEKQKEEDNNNNIKQKEKEKEENENNNINNNIKEISDIKTSKKENKEKDIKKEVKNEQKNKEIKQENNEDNKEEAKEKEFDFNINNINNNDNINNQPINNNNNDNNNNLDNNNNNNIPKNNKPEQIIPKNVYDKISANDKKFVADLLKACNAKYQEGEAFASMGKYTEALKCYSVAKNLFLKSNKVIQSKKNVYPKEFMMKITSIISDKLKLVHQAAKNCSNAIKEKIINKANLRNNNNNFDNNIDNNNIDNNNNNNNVNNNNIDNNKNNNNEYKNNNNKINNNKPNLDKNDDKNINNYNFDFNELNNNNKNNNNNKIRNQNAFNNNNNNSNQNNKPKSLHDKEEDAMDEKILSEIMTKNPGVKFSDIIGMNDMKQTLYEIIVVPTIRPDLFTGIRTPQRGILLFGPPGTGKTMIAKAIASECGSTFFNISASSLTSKWVGESEKTVKSLFKIAYQKVPSIIFIDEIDSILSKRSESENEATKRLKTEFLIQFDGLGSNTSARLLVIAATNRPMDLDEALLRRLPKRVYCGPLDEDGRFEFIKKVINRVETDLSDEDIKEIAKMTNDYSNSDLMELCREAAYRPVRELTNDEILKLDKFRPINKKDLLDAVHKIRGTLSKKVKEDLRKWNEQFGGV